MGSYLTLVFTFCFNEKERVVQNVSMPHGMSTSFDTLVRVIIPNLFHSLHQTQYKRNVFLLNKNFKILTLEYLRGRRQEKIDI